MPRWKCTTRYMQKIRAIRVVFWMGRAVAQQNLGQTESAIQSYNEVLDVAPGNPDAMVNSARVDGKPRIPAPRCTACSIFTRNFPTIPVLLRRLALPKERRAIGADAMKYLGEAESLEPSNPQHPFNMAVLADRQGNAPDAIKFYEQALQVDSVNGDDQSIPRDKIV